MSFEPAEAAEAGAVTAAHVGRVIVGVDDSESGLAALREAVRLAQSHHVQLVAVRAWALGLPRHGGRRLKHLVHRHIVLYFSGLEQRAVAAGIARDALQRAVGELPSDLDLVIETPAGDPALALIGIARQPGDLLVVGRRRTLSARGLVHGSVSAYIERHAQCPVMVVSAGGAISTDPEPSGGSDHPGESAA
jgi:nucleotide-binding universal stress UspA family protein